MSEHLTRKFKIESIRAADKKNAFWGTLSTEYSVARGYGNEILLHDSKSIDLSRAPLPLVISHNTNELNIGVVEKLEIVGRKLKGLIRLGNSPKALEIIDDIRGGILTNLSIGYHILDSYLDGDDLIATLWAPHEVSLVSVGADPDSGIGRSLNNFNGEKTMSNKTNEPGTEPSERLSRNQRAQARDATEKERERIAEIDSLAGYFTREIPKNSESAIRSMDEKRKEFIKKGYSIDDFRTWGRDFIDIHGRKSASVPSADDMYQRGVYSGEGGYGGDDDFSRFSVCKAIQDRIDPGSVDAGYENEISRELGRRIGKNDNLIRVPMGRSLKSPVQRSMNVATAGTGGNLVDDIMYPGSFIEPLTPRSVIGNLNITEMKDMVGDVTLPGSSADPTADTYLLDDSGTIVASDPTISQLNMSPTSIAALVTLSHKFVRQSSLDAENYARQALSRAVGVKLDQQVLNGDGTGQNMTGVINTAGIGALTYLNGGSPTWANVVGLESELTVDDVDMMNVAYLASPSMIGTLKTTEKASGTAKFLLEDGMLNGYPVLSTSQVPAGTILIGCWSDAVVATWSSLTLEIDPYTGFKKKNVDVSAVLDVDVGFRHVESFAVLTEAAI